MIQPDVSIIIVTWNSESEIGDCLSSIAENKNGLLIETIIVDNNSSDDTLAVIKNFTENVSLHLKIISNNSNEGFTKATNAGIRESAGKKIFLMNPDAKLTENALQFMIVKLDMDDTIGAAAPQLLNSNGSIQKSCRRFPEYFDMFCELTLLSYIFPESKIFSRWKMNYFDHNSEREVDQPMAAALMLKRSILEKTCAFDERFNMFFNDVDLCKKIYENENKIVFTPNAKVYHKKGVSIYKDRIRMIRIWNEDCLKYFKKYKYNIILYNWLLLNLKLSGFFRILYYKLKK